MPEWSINVKKGEKSYTLNSAGLNEEWCLYIKNHHDEGMSISETILFDLLDKYFKEEF